jgi:TPR repeat protein
MATDKTDEHFDVSLYLLEHVEDAKRATRPYQCFLQAQHLLACENIQGAVLLLELAVAAGITEAKNDLGLILRNGLGGVLKDEPRALVLLKEANDEGFGGATGSLIFGSPSDD